MLHLYSKQYKSKKMKRLFDLKPIILCIITLVLFASCSKHDVNLKYIPTDSKFISIIDADAIMMKGDLKNYKELNLYSEVQEMFGREDDSSAKLMQEILEDPTLLGVNFLKDMYIYHATSNDNSNLIIAQVALSNSQKLKDLLVRVDSEENLELDFIKEDNYEYISNNEEMAIVWNDDVLLAVVSPQKSVDFKTELVSLMSAKEESSILNNAKVLNLLKDKKDISYWFSYDLFELIPQFKMIKAQMPYSLSDASMFMSLDFDTDKIVCRFKTDLNEEMQTYVSKLYPAGTKFNKELTNLFPKECYIGASAIINPTALYEQMKATEQAAKIYNNIETELEFSFEELYNSFKGSFILSIFDFKVVGPNPIPQLAIACDLNSNEYIHELIKKLPSEMISKDGDNYTISTPMGINAYIHNSNSLCYLTNSIEAFNNLKDGGYGSESLTNSARGKLMNQSIGYFYTNMNLNTYPQNIKSLPTKMGVRQNYVSTWNNFFDYVEFSSDASDITSGQMKLQLVKKNQNSLKTFIHLIDDNYKNI